MLTYVSEPPIPEYNNSNFYGNWPKKFENLERNDLAIKVLSKYKKDLFNNYFKIIRLHPKQNLNDLEIEKLNENFDLVSIDHDHDNILFITDLLFGITSSLLIEGAILGIPSFSIQSRLNDSKDIPSFIKKNIKIVKDIKFFEDFNFKNYRNKKIDPIAIPETSKILRSIFSQVQ